MPLFEKNGINYIAPELKKAGGKIDIAFSTKLGLKRTGPFWFNLSKSVGEDENIVNENRDEFFNLFGFDYTKAACHHQIHSDIIRVVTQPGFLGESDAMITNISELPLVVVSADCTLVFLFDPVNNAIAAIHSGWRGTEQKIVAKTVYKLKDLYKSKAENLLVWVSPCISGDKYEVGNEVAEQFDARYVIKKGESLYLDIKQNNIDMLLESGVKAENIEDSGLCSFTEADLLHSYRRDGKVSGRAIGFIKLNGNKEK